MTAGDKLRNVLEGRHPPLREKFGQRVSSLIEQKIRKQCELLPVKVLKLIVNYNNIKWIRSKIYLLFNNLYIFGLIILKF